MRGLAVLLLAALGGCSAMLSDARYGCVDGQCPAGFVCWSSDSRCHTGPETVDMGVASVDMGPMPDMGMPPPDMGALHMACTMPAMCTGGAGADCVVGAWAGPMPSFACAVMSQITNATHGMPCTMGAVCISPDACIPGTVSSHCFRPCGMPGADHCGFGETCAAHGTMGGTCLHSCIAGACPGGGAICVSGFCQPPNW